MPERIDDTASHATESEDYARRLQAKQQVWWKKLLNVQAPYQWNLRRQHLGRTLDVGCGIGRNLKTLGQGSVGVDHNSTSVELARQGGMTALTVEEWESSDLRQPDAFDGLLLAHVIEHLDARAAEQIMRDYLPFLKPGGKVFFVCPQERGYASDPTHIRFADERALTELALAVDLVPEPWFSFPFPRWAGNAFIYNEFCMVAVKPDASQVRNRWTELGLGSRTDAVAPDFGVPAPAAAFLGDSGSVGDPPAAGREPH